MKDDEQQHDEPRYSGGDSVSWVNDVLDDCQLGIYNKEAITAANTPGRPGVVLAKKAMATGISILTGIRGESGERIFGMDARKQGQEFIKIFPSDETVINIAYHIKNSLSDTLLPELTSTVEGAGGKDGRKRDIKSTGFKSSSISPDSAMEMSIADESRWALANCTMMDDLAWIEAQFTIYDVITNPMTPLSIIAMTDQWDNDIADDEYFANLLKESLAYERQKLIDTLDAQKKDDVEELDDVEEP